MVTLPGGSSSDLVLYAALLVGLLAGRLRTAPAALDRTARATVLLLVGALGVEIAGAGVVDLPAVLLPSLLMGSLLVATSALFVLGLTALFGRKGEATAAGPVPPVAPSTGRADPSETTSKEAGAPTGPSGQRQARLLPWFTLAALIVGIIIGAGAPRVTSAGSSVLEAALVLLLFQVGWGIRLTRRALRLAPLPLAAAGLSALVVGSLGVVALGLPLRASFAIVAASGWYSLAGPLVGRSAGATLGLIAFLANFLREDLTMIGAPVLARVAGAPAIVASGGATSMDTTLFFAVTYGGREAGGLALATGTVLTLAAPFLLNALMG